MRVLISKVYDNIAHWRELITQYVHAMNKRERKREREKEKEKMWAVNCLCSLAIVCLSLCVITLTCCVGQNSFSSLPTLWKHRSFSRPQEIWGFFSCQQVSNQFCSRYQLSFLTQPSSVCPITALEPINWDLGLQDYLSTTFYIRIKNPKLYLCFSLPDYKSEFLYSFPGFD